MAAKMVTPKVNAQEVVEAVKNSGQKCLILYASPQEVLISKHIEVAVNRINANSVFQPYEYVENKIYCILALLKIRENPKKDDSKNEIVTQLIKQGCPCFTIENLGAVQYVLEGLK